MLGFKYEIIQYSQQCVSLKMHFNEFSPIVYFIIYSIVNVKIIFVIKSPNLDQDTVNDTE